MPRRPDTSPLDDLAARVGDLRFAVYGVVGWRGDRRVSGVVGARAVAVVHTQSEPRPAWVEVETRLVDVGRDAGQLELEAAAALEEVLWIDVPSARHGLRADADASRIVAANLAIERRVQHARRWRLRLAVDGAAVELAAVGDRDAWAALGRVGGVAVRIAARGFEPSWVALECVDPRAL